MKKRQALTSFLIAACLMSVMSQGWALENNVQITGSLVSEPCTLDPKQSDIPLDFGNLVGKYFALNARTPGETFNIVLIGCDISLGQSATVTFLGTQSGILPGLLAPDDGDTHGIAIGIEQLDGKQVPLGKPTPAYQLTEGTNTLTLKGYVAAPEPDAVSNRKIVFGPFTATATFEVAYP
ncbi:type 1 fimbrial protein [Buttiauxella sp. B2]|uniref:fimbrial protein n=1 Tax=Buttiauxella sp. B2 TaxID=2587812 RepID=UPI00111F6F4E|nr:fimbrial protein [Buttiauxella sp. B2]TNV22518.1 type 1 fimbrial protein [Buttiauxella sp. B2]